MARRTKTPDASTGNSRIATPAPVRGSRRALWLGFALVALVLLVYLPALSGGFIWDDDAHLTRNPCIVGPLGFLDIWTIAHARICPLVQSTFWLEHRIWGLEPLPYHLVNILLQGAGAIVLWRVLLQLRVPGAWLGAALWAVHPVQVESVAWITEMKNTQSGLFFLLAVLFFCKSRRDEAEGPPGGRIAGHYFLSLVFAALAMASKSSTVVLPLVLGLCAWWIDRGWRWKRNIIQLTPLLLMSIATSLVTVWTQEGEGAFEPEFARTLAERIAGVGRVVWFYLGKLAWPHPLIFVYPKWHLDTATVAVYLPTLLAAALLIVLWWKRNQWARGPFFAAAYFVAALAPVLGMVDTYFWRYSFVGDHFQYLAGMGPLALAAAGFTRGASRLRRYSRWVTSGAGALLVVALGILSWRQCEIYQSDETLWATTVRLNPESWIAHNNLAVDLSHEPGSRDEVIAHYEASLRLRPNHAKAQYNLAVELEKVPGRIDEAIEHYEAAVKYDPSLGLAHLNLGALLARIPGRQADAIAQDEEAVRLVPDSAEAHYNLAIELWKIPGRNADVIAQYQEALRLKPDLAEAQYNLALALVKEPDRAAEAAEHFEAALRLRPEWPEANYAYGILLSGPLGRLPEAIGHLEKAERLQPDNPHVHYNLAGAYYRTGRLSDAIRELETTLKLAPGFEDARGKLDMLRRQQGN